MESKTPNSTVVCGQINAKNSYGAYVGFKMFDYIKLEATEVAHFTNFMDLNKIRQSRPDLIEPYIKAGCWP